MKATAIGVALLLWATATPAHEVAPEGAAKAAYVYNFGKFVEWPDPPDARESFGICVLGRTEPFIESVLSLSGRPLQGRPIKAWRLERAEAYAECRILVIGASEARNLRRILDLVANQPVLTVSDIPGFAALGGTIGLFITPDDRIGFEINARASRNAGLRIRASLIALSRPVTESGRP